MMVTIWKYKIDLRTNPEQEFAIPDGGSVVFFGIDPQAEISTQLAVWVLVDTAQPMVKRTFSIFGTGIEIKITKYTYLCSTVVPPFAWHLCERKQ